jgi:hypothetical protein
VAGGGAPAPLPQNEKLTRPGDALRLKFLNVIDDHTRLCLAILVCRRSKPRDVVAVLEEFTTFYPASACISSDTGPELIAHALRWCSKRSVTTTTYIEPGSPLGELPCGILQQAV